MIRKFMPRIELLRMLCLVCMSFVVFLTSCSFVGSATYKPPFVPIDFVIDTEGHISIQADASIASPIGDFSVGASAEQSLQPPNGGILFIIDRLISGQPMDTAFKINENNAVKTVVIDHQVTLQFTGNLISINARGHHDILLTSSSVPQTTAIPADPSRACRAIKEFAHSGTATGGSSFPAILFPAGSLSYPISRTYYGSYLSQRIEVCSPTMTANGIRAFMLDRLPEDNWIQSSTFPYEGDPSRACGDPYCWTQNSAPAYYISLEQVTQRGSVTLYMLRLGTLP